jgi:LPXTG-motif cell wall-anchored protein
MSTPHTTPTDDTVIDTTPEETTSDTIPGGGPDEVPNTIADPNCESGWANYDGSMCIPVVVTYPPTTTPAPTTTAVGVAPVAPVVTTTTPTAAAPVVETVAVVGVKPTTLPATGAGDAGSIALTGGLLAAVGVAAIMFARRKNARV